MTFICRKHSLMMVAFGVSACGGRNDATIKVMQPIHPVAAMVQQLTDVESATSQVIGVIILDQSERIAAGSPVLDSAKAAAKQLRSGSSGGKGGY